MLDSRCNKFLSSELLESVYAAVDEINTLFPNGRKQDGKLIDKLRLHDNFEERAEVAHHIISGKQEELIKIHKEEFEKAKTEEREDEDNDLDNDLSRYELDPNDIDVIAAKIERVFVEIRKEQCTPYNPKKDPSLESDIISALSSSTVTVECEDEGEKNKAFVDEVISQVSSNIGMSGCYGDDGDELVNWSSRDISPFEIPGIIDAFRDLGE